MMRKTFDLSNAEFSDDSDEDGRQIPHDLIEMYNRDYSLILSETKNFFSDVFVLKLSAKIS